MKLNEFKVLARSMGATMVYEHSATAVFSGPQFSVTIDLNNDQLEQAKPVELTYTMADLALLN